MASVYKRRGRPNYYVSWFDHTGERCVRSSGTTDKRAAERMAAKLVADALLRRDGVIDPHTDRYTASLRCPLSVHLEAYYESCELQERSRSTMAEKRRQLARLTSWADVSTLADITPDVVLLLMRTAKGKGLSHRQANYVRGMFERIEG